MSKKHLDDVKLNVRLPKDVHDSLTIVGKFYRTSMNALIIKAVREDLIRVKRRKEWSM